MLKAWKPGKGRITKTRKRKSPARGDAKERQSAEAREQKFMDASASLARWNSPTSFRPTPTPITPARVSRADAATRPFLVPPKRLEKLRVIYADLGPRRTPAQHAPPQSRPLLPVLINSRSLLQILRTHRLAPPLCGRGYALSFTCRDSRASPTQALERPPPMSLAGKKESPTSCRRSYAGTKPSSGRNYGNDAQPEICRPLLPPAVASCSCSLPDQGPRRTTCRTAESGPVRSPGSGERALSGQRNYKARAPQQASSGGGNSAFAWLAICGDRRCGASD